MKRMTYTEIREYIYRNNEPGLSLAELDHISLKLYVWFLILNIPSDYSKRCR